MPLGAADVPSHITTDFRSPKELVAQGITAPELYDWHAKENPNYPLFTYHDGDKHEYITYAMANLAIDRAARYVTSCVSQTPKRDEERPTVAIFANADTITYFCTVIGVMRAGYTVFLISTRNGPAGVADMLQRTDASQMLISPDTAVRNVAHDTLGHLPAGQLTLQAMPTFEDLFPKDAESVNKAFESEVKLPETYDPNAYALILHSSGSTGHPKPIRWTHRWLTSFGRGALSLEVDTSRSVMGCHGTLMSHGLGAFLYVSTVINGYVVAAFKPQTPPRIPIPSAVWEGIAATKCDYIWAVPSFIEEWARDPVKVQFMRRTRGVFFGGAPLPSEVGDALASQGVSLFTIYGLTEVGMVNLPVRPNLGLDWSYFCANPVKQVRFVPHGDNKFEVVILSDPNLPLPVTNMQYEGQDAYATGDLVVPHDTIPGLWTIYGRTDEQIILSNGEKTNPLPLEKIVNRDPHVKSCIMFGSGKFQNGILVQPHEQYAIDPSNIAQLEAFRNRIWPSVERANEFAPQHSRIFKEMILVTSPTKPLQFNVKGLPRRKIILKNYHDEIEACYKEVEDSAQADVPSPQTWDKAGTLAFVRAVVNHTMRQSVPDGADIFRNGCDSLQATWIRNTILRALREVDPSASKRLNANFVFNAPTISSLSNVVQTALNNLNGVDDASRAPQDLWKYVEKYSAGFPARPADLLDRPSAAKDVVLITGTTGGFGCDALEHLLRDETIERVYAFNRKSTNAAERQRVQFRERGLDEMLLDSPKFIMVEAILHEPDFGIEPQLLDKIRHSITHIMHNAWKVDFNLSLHSFEVDLQATRNLIDLVISSPFRRAPTMLFVSSIGVFRNYQGHAPAPETTLDDPGSPFGSGYPEAKWIAEHILQNATKATGVRTVVMRLGQVCGDRLGHWNEKEWFPALVKSAQFLRCLPDVDGDITWIPGYEGAKAFTEMRKSPEPIVHLVHPRPVPWRTVIAPIAAELQVPLVPYETWLSALEASTRGMADATEVELMKANPALRIVDFFRHLKQSPDHEPLGMVYLSSEKATKVSGTLTRMPALDAGRARKWLAAWKKSGFLST
ncbi:acetyl-CoA synthetase-like protein [Cubamyces sp. BRFM 1775]|nr:acetyl-CoA synthetase-like protein [Cubamyces sp. BRFM 1775]